MKCWNCCIKALKKTLKYVLQNVTISYDKIKYDINEISLTFLRKFLFFYHVTHSCRKSLEQQFRNSLTLQKCYKYILSFKDFILVQYHYLIWPIKLVLFLILNYATHIYLWVRICVCVCVFVCVWVNMCVNACVCVSIYMCVLVCVFLYMCL